MGNPGKQIGGARERVLLIGNHIYISLRRGGAIEGGRRGGENVFGGPFVVRIFVKE